MKKCISLMMSAFLLIGLSGCSGSVNEGIQETGQLTVYEDQNETPIDGGTLRLALAGAKNLNPILAENRNNLQVLGLLFDGLFTRTENDRLEPVLCESYTVSEDGLHYEFTLKDGVTFHNGASLTARDVDRTLALLLASEGVYRGRFADVASHEARDMTLLIHLSRPVTNFAALLDFPVLSEGDLGSVENAIHTASSYVPNGTGRYKVQSYKKSKELYLSVNQSYHRPFKPHISDILIYLLKDRETAVSMLENLQVDMLPSEIINLHAYTPKRNLSSCEYTNGHFTFLGINNQRMSLLNATTRIALAVSIDKQRLLEGAAVQYAEGTDLPLPVHSVWNDAELPAVGHDIAYAKTLLLEEGWADSDNDGILDKSVYGEKTDLQLEILVNEENQTRLRLAEGLQGYFEEAGIAAYVTAVPFGVYEQRIAAREYDLFIGGVSLSENYDLSFFFQTDANYFGVSNAETDRILQALPLARSEAEKQTLFHELCSILKWEMPIISLYFEKDMLIFDKRVKGNIRPSASDLFYGIEEWFLSKV